MPDCDADGIECALEDLKALRALNKREGFQTRYPDAYARLQEDIKSSLKTAVDKCGLPEGAEPLELATAELGPDLGYLGPETELES